MTKVKEEYEEHAAKAAKAKAKAKQKAKLFKRDGKLLQVYKIWQRRLRPKLIVRPQV